LPELGRSLGRSLSEFKRASNELRATLDEEIRVDEQRQADAARQPAAPTQAPSEPTSAAPDSSVPRTPSA
jgi:Sec-independent protein translocase protein TatA